MKRLTKIIGLAGGGVLAFGSGAAGTHFAYPAIERNLFPERIHKEEKLKEFLGESESEVIRLGQELTGLEKLNSSQKKQILSLDKKSKELNVRLNDQEQELTKKDKEIQDKTNELSTQETLFKEQQQKICDLEKNIQTKDNDLQQEKTEKQRIEGNLDGIKRRLALKKEDILTKKSLDKDLIRINIQKIEFKGFDGEWAEFEVTNRDSSISKIKVNKENPTSHEETVKKIQKIGIPFGINQTSFDKWDKKIKVTRFDVDYDHKVTEEGKKRHFVKEQNKQEDTITLTDYFKGSYLKEAFRVYMAITRIDHFSLRYDWSGSSQEKRFYFFKDSKVDESLLFLEQEVNWDGFNPADDSKKFFITTNIFNTIDDFIKYWSEKTVEFVRTGTVDFSGILNPINRLNYYVKG